MLLLFQEKSQQMAVVGFIFPCCPLYLLSETLPKFKFLQRPLKAMFQPQLADNTRNTNENDSVPSFTQETPGLFQSRAGTGKRVHVFWCDAISHKRTVKRLYIS